MTHKPEPVVAAPVLGDGGVPRPDGLRPGRKAPPAAVAARLIATWRAAGGGDMLLVAGSERRADEIARALGAMITDDDPVVMVFPPWDCLPYDRASPSRESMGRRMAVLARLAEAGPRGRLVVSSPEAMMQRTPPGDIADARFDIAVGAPLDREVMAEFAARTGYIRDERVDEPGEIAIHGEVIDIYPAAATSPFRIVMAEDGSVAEIKAFDPVSQRSRESASALSLTAASELVVEGDGAEREATPGEEHHLQEHYGQPLGDLFQALPGGRIVLDEGVLERAERTEAQIREAFEARRSFSDADGRSLAAVDSLYLSLPEFSRAVEGAEALDLAGLGPVPHLARAGAAGTGLKRYLQVQRAAGRRVVLAGLAHEQRVMARLLRRNRIEPPAAVETWEAVGEAGPGALVSLVADFDEGYADAREDLVLLTATDLTGGRIAQGAGASTDLFGETEVRLGDVVIHEEHGLGVLRALEQVEADGVVRDVLRLEYYGGAAVLAPVEELDRIWRYSAEPAAIKLDRLNGQAWLKRRAEVSAQIDATALCMIEMARAREATATDRISPSRPDYARFASRFPFPESVDQLAAIDDVLRDLASGRPMNRLVCGDVGFGKTEVALRAAAAVALSGRQVMLAAPTTVLARQHYETFRQRCEGSGIQVGRLSRLVDGGEVQDVRRGLEDGSIQVVIGTQALADDTLVFADLALVIIDEEHRFGAALKARLADLAPHLLALSATPIPRTLQGALVGVQDVSILASPPARRRPVRTFMTDDDGASLTTVLRREKRRGGQSFVVAPRIEDLEPLAARLSALVPELSVIVAHGKLTPDDMDAAMSTFAEGRGDVLLSTNIVENGLDVPRANTIVIWRPDRFGLAQLHQLRGRVGRGRRQGFAYLLSDPGAELAQNTRARLQTLEALDRLGAGFAISARDLDLRGGGDLVGEEQAGHIRLIGASLYQRVLARALREARGEVASEPAPPKTTLNAKGRFPETYVPDPSVRISLYARLARCVSAEEIDAFSEEIEDRFGPPPETVTALLDARRLTALARVAGVTELVSGPKATALAFGSRARTKRARALSKGRPKSDAWRWSGDRLLIETSGGERHDQVFLEAILVELAEAAECEA
ncbi:DEAD/DEAH box helicase [Brevundimonas sp.]|uniref:DEAD/DEAH box helicase n=1 Tax=Brevundimonas sp. TaxID=1871086 RepID=UPI0028996C36|nr:DEAD/DEAH box helicase [Brevundimonas sp.]